MNQLYKISLYLVTIIGLFLSAFSAYANDSVDSKTPQNFQCPNGNTVTKGQSVA